MLLKKFTYLLLLLSCILALFLFTLLGQKLINVSLNELIIIFIYYFFTTWLSFYLIERKKNDGFGFITNVMLSNSLRVFSTLIFFVTYIILKGFLPLHLAIIFMLLYLFYTVFEIYFLVTNLHANSKKPKG